MPRDMDDEVRTDGRSLASRVLTDRSGTVVGTAAVYLFGSLVLTRGAAGVGLPVDAGAGLALGLGVVFGPLVAVGAGLGSALTDVLTGTAGAHTAVGFAASFLLVLVAVTFWNTLGQHGSLATGIGLLLRYVLAVVPATLTAGAVHAWGAELFLRQPFIIAFLAAVVDVLVGALTVGLLVFAASRWRGGDTTETDPAGPAFSTRLTALTVAGVPLVWGCIGVGLSVVFRPLQLEHTQIIANRFGWTAARAIALAGPGGRSLQLLVGAVGFVTVSALLVRELSTV